MTVVRPIVRRFSSEVFEPAGVGVWIGPTVDSRLYDCRWDWIEFEGLRPAPATRVSIWCRTANESSELDEDELDNADFGPEAEPPVIWHRILSVVAPAEASEEEAPPIERLIGNPPGRYLKLAMQVEGGPVPAPFGLHLYTPRDSWLDLLPSVFHQDPVAEEFLERLLSVFRLEWGKLEGELDRFRRYLDPGLVPTKDAAGHLADWFALPIEDDWTLDARRRVLEAMLPLQSARGTRKAFETWLRQHLAASNGLMLAETQGFPQVVEGFHERRFLAIGHRLGACRDDGMGLATPPLSDGVQLDTGRRLDEVSLVSPDHPQEKTLDRFANGVRICVPKAWVGDPPRRFKAAIEAELPAHLNYEVQVVRPGLRLGVQRFLGVDTVLGDWPEVRVAGSAAPPPGTLRRGMVKPLPEGAADG